MNKKCLSLYAALGLAAASGRADFVLNVINVSVGENFNSFTGGGFAPTPGVGQLDSDTWIVTGFDDGSLDFGDTGTTGDFARGTSTGGVSSGGIYGFNTGGGDIGLGVQSSASDFTPGAMVLRLLNSTGVAITELELSYDIKVLNDQGRSNSFNFSHSADGSSFDNLSGLDYTSPDASDANGWVTVNRSTTISGLNIANGGNYFLRWTGNDVGGSGSRDEFALDNLSIRGVGVIPEPGTFGLLLLALVVVARLRRP